MAILYSLVARDGIVLGEYTTEAGNFQTITRLLLPRVPQTSTRMSYVCDEHIFHHFFSNGLCYLAMCHRSTNLTVPYLFLQDVATMVQTEIPPIALKTSIALGLNSQLEPLLAHRMKQWNRFIQSGSISPQFARVQSQIAEIHDIMVDNIDKILARHEKINLLVDRTEELVHDAVEFRRQARRYNRKIWWLHKRYIVFLVLLLTGVVIGASMFICGGILYNACRSHNTLTYSV